MSKKAPVPIFYLEGNAAERGFQYGTQAKDLIVQGLDMYRGLLKKQSKIEWTTAIETVKKYVPAIKKFNPQALDEMNGIAKGAGRSFEEILILNARSELVYSASLPAGAKRPQEQECITIVATPEITLNGHMIIGKNTEAAQPMHDQPMVLLKEKRTDGVNVVAFEQEAGVIARAGINAAGLGVAGTALHTQKMAIGIPNQVLCNKLIYSKTVAEALLAIARAERASSLIRVIASADGTAALVEWGAPKAYSCILPEEGVLVGSLYCQGNNPEMVDTIRFPGYPRFL